MIAFDIKVDVFSEEEMKPDSLSSNMMQKAIDVSGVMGLLDVIPDIFHTSYLPFYRKFYEGITFMERYLFVIYRCNFICTFNLTARLFTLLTS